MRRLLATIVSATLIGLAGAGEAPVLAQLSIPDGTRLIQHVQASIFGRLWRDPALAPLRARLDRVLPAFEEQAGFPLLALPESLTSAQATLFGLATGAPAERVAAYKQAPDFTAQAGLGQLAAQIFAKLKAAGATMIIPGAAEAVTIGANQAILARLGELLIAGNEARRLIPAVIAPSPHDVTLRVDGLAIAQTLRAAMTPEESAKAEGVLKALHRFLVPAVAHLDITPTHIASSFAATTTLPFLTPIDLALCAHLPANAYAVNAAGLDGGLLWLDLIAPLVAAAAANQGTTPEALLQLADQRLAALGTKCTVQELVSGLRGTWMVAQTPGAPLPGYTIAIPRSPACDELVGLLLQQMGNELPAEGDSTPLTFPNLPLPVSLVRDRGHWVVSSDAVLASSWTTTADGGWLASPLGALAKAKAGPGALMMAVSDTAAELRAMQGYLSMGMGALPLEPKEKQAVMRGFSTLIANAGLAHEVMRQQGDTLVSEGQSMLGGSSSSIAVIAVIAAIAIPNLLESRVAANEAAAAATLKSGIFPAEIQFQAGGYRDLDGDNVGEYGFLAELAGGKVPGNERDLQLSLLMPSERWNQQLPESNGYRFAIFLPDGAGGATAVDAAMPARTPAAADASERDFIAYAWPVDGKSGRKVFALTSRGGIHALPPGEWDGEAPVWNALFGGEGTGWQDAPVWPQHRK